ncbi:MAG: hypothetical protein GTO30_01530, partial [Acidobacteria bacterium]|nr:hypothetical protein [Acidobacteriota bacterium]NIQ85102.1 hypothetical protein [Acidobacteriota bacterium]
MNAIFTDEKGQFTLRGLPAGERLKLFANASEHRAAESETLTLGEGAVLGGITIVHRRPASAKVRLVDVDDVPVGALDVLWLAVKEGPRKSEGGFRVAGFEGLTVVESEGQGRFAISQIEPGRYDVTLLPDGYQAIRIEGLNVPAGARLDWGTRIVQPGATLSGYVVNDLGDAIEKATLRATYLREGTATSRTATSETDGRFVLGGLPDGALLWLRVEAEGHGPFMEQDVGTGQSDYEVTLERVGAITGIVSLESGDPPEGVTATLEPVAGGPISFGRRKQEAVGADGDGRFEIKDAAPGDYHVRLTAKGARPLRVKGVTVTAGDSIDIGTHRLEQGRSISGSVLDARNGAPVTGAAINVEARGGGLTGSISSLGA